MSWIIDYDTGWRRKEAIKAVGLRLVADDVSRCWFLASERLGERNGAEGAVFVNRPGILVAISYCGALTTILTVSPA